MGERCGCVSRECTCGIFQGEGVLIGGTGTEANPHIIEVGPTATKMVGVASSYVDVAVTGDGTAISPYSVKMVKSLLNPPAAPLSPWKYLTAGTYTLTKPTSCTLMQVVLDGAGAGGTSGNTDGTGGLGGAGGGRVDTFIPVSSGAFDLTIQVGAGGTGGVNPGGAAGYFSGIAGGDTTLTIPDPAGALTLRATGGKPTQAGYLGTALGVGGLGSMNGQAATFSNAPMLSDISSGAGGRGSGNTAAGDGGRYAGRAGGKHAMFTTVRYNLVKNPSFEYGIAGWENRTNATLAWQTTGGAVPGQRCLKVTAIATAVTEVQQSAVGLSAIPITPGGPQSLIFKVLTSVAGRDIGLGMGFWDASGAAITGLLVGGVISAGPGAWNPVAYTFTAPSNAAFARVFCRVSGMSAGEWYYLDQVGLEQAATPGVYWDGDYATSGGVTYDWLGTQGDSYSVQLTEDPSKTIAFRGGGIGGDGGNFASAGGDGQGHGGGGGGGGSGDAKSAGGPGGRGSDGAAWIIFY